MFGVVECASDVPWYVCSSLLPAGASVETTDDTTYKLAWALEMVSRYLMRYGPSHLISRFLGGPKNSSRYISEMPSKQRNQGNPKEMYCTSLQILKQLGTCAKSMEIQTKCTVIP